MLRITVCNAARRNCLLVAILLLVSGGCKTIRPSNDRDWAPDQAVLPYAEFEGSAVRVHNIRNCNYLTADDYVVDYYDKTFDLAALETVDFVMVPFPDLPSIAHTMLSFGFGDEDYLAVSVEIRREKGETYQTWKGSLRQYELMYVVGDERDLIRLRTNLRNDDVYLYRARATPEQARDLFVDVMKRANKLRARPEFYDLVTNNCTTNIVGHINRLAPNRIPYSYQVILPGYSDRLAYDLGLLETNGSFEATKQAAWITARAQQFDGDPAFSQKIRR